MKFLIYVTSSMFLLVATAGAAKPEKVLICHIGSDVIEQVDEETGEVTEVEVETYKSKLLPAKAAAKHIANHGDFEIVADDNGDLTPCESLADGIDAVEMASLLRSASAGTNNDDLETPADIIHPDIHQNNGPGSAACPGDQDHCQNMHGIGNNPGRSDADPADGEPGFADQLEKVHGGIGSKNPNAD